MGRNVVLPYSFLKKYSPKDMFIDFREKGRERERETERERDINYLPPIHSVTGGGTHCVGMRPDQRLNPQPLGVQDNAPTN